MHWLLGMSINAININVSVTEQDWCECEIIAREHGCDEKGERHATELVLSEQHGNDC